MSDPLIPPNTPTAEEKILLSRLLQLDVDMRSNPKAEQLGQTPGDGLVTYLKIIINRLTGIDL